MTKFKMRVFLTLFSLILLAISASAETVSNSTYSAEVQTTAGGNINSCSGTYCGDTYVDAVSGQTSNSTYTVQLGGGSSESDQNVVIRITSPKVASIVVSSPLNITYALVHASDINFIKNFWVSSGGLSGTYVNKGLNLTPGYVVSDGSYTFCVKATKKTDVNTVPVCVSVTVSIPSTTTTTTTTSAAGSVLGKAGAAETVVTEPTVVSETIVSELTISGDTLTQEDIASILELVGADPSITQAAEELSSKISIDRTVKVVERTYSDNTTQIVTQITLTVTNSDEVDYSNVIVVEYIPKAVAESASLLLKGLDEFEVLLEDPAIQFTVSELAAGESITLSYDINKEVTEDALTEWTAAFASTAEGITNLCEGVICKSSKCKPAKCNQLTGKCKYSYAEEGTTCEATKVCDGLGKCVEKAVEQPVTTLPPAEETKPPQDYTTVLGVLAVVIVLGAAAYLMTKKKKESSKFSYKK